MLSQQTKGDLRYLLDEIRADLTNARRYVRENDPGMVALAAGAAKDNLDKLIRRAIIERDVVQRGMSREIAES